jgi:ribonuclease VapC
LTVVLDSSAILAYLQREPGFEAVSEALRSGPAVSTVNLAEVLAKVALRVELVGQVAGRLRALGVTSFEFTDDDAHRSAALRPLTSEQGLALGDRACLALGQRLGWPVLTAERIWRGLEVGVEIRHIR